MIRRQAASGWCTSYEYLDHLLLLRYDRFIWDGQRSKVWGHTNKTVYAALGLLMKAARFPYVSHRKWVLRRTTLDYPSKDNIPWCLLTREADSKPRFGWTGRRPVLAVNIDDTYTWIYRLKNRLTHRLDTDTKIRAKTLPIYVTAEMSNGQGAEGAPGREIAFGETDMKRSFFFDDNKSISTYL